MSGAGDEDLHQLVRSLDDLDAELEAGDLDKVDYETLRNDYTVRAADAVRARQSPTSRVTGDGKETSTVETVGSSLPRVLMVSTALLMFAVGAGWLLARSAGERGIGDTLTGSIDQSSRQKVAECQEIGVGQGELLDAIQCFDEVLISEPENVEALSYRAWFLVLATGSSGEAADDQQAELLGAAAVYLDEAIDIDPTYPDARAFRAVVADRERQPDEVCRQIASLIDLDPPPFFVEQTRPVAERNGCG